MLRISFFQWCFDLSGPQAEDAICDSESMRRFARVELGKDHVPDESTILRFRHLLEKHRLTELIFEAIKELLEAHHFFLRTGTIVDATIIAAPSSTKNGTKSWDPEMMQTRKGKNWHFGTEVSHWDGSMGPRLQPVSDACCGGRYQAASEPAPRRRERSLRRPNLLEKSGSVVVRGTGRAVSNQPTRPSWQPQLERAMAQDQPSPLTNPCSL